MKKVESKIITIENQIECSIVRRINRFVVEIQVSGSYYPAWINNTGRLQEFLINGKKGFCVRNERRGNLGAIIDTQLQMKAFEKSLEMKLIP